MLYDICLPDGFTERKEYPLFLCMHCDSGSIGNIETHRRYWKPDAMLACGFIVVCIQSSYLLSSIGYGWSDDAPRRREDIRKCFDEVGAQYKIDKEKVIVSGFSGGALAAIDAALHDIIPVREFIAMSPDKPEDFSKEKCKNAFQRGVRGVLMEGELAGSDVDVEEMKTVFNQTGLPYEVFINEGIGHWYPDDLPAKTGKAISFILNE